MKPWYKTNLLPLKIRNNLVMASKTVTLGVTLTFANLTLGRKGDKKVKIRLMSRRGEAYYVMYIRELE